MKTLTLKLYDEINHVRNEHGLSLCIPDFYLVIAAQNHANDMFFHDFVSHIGSNGSTYISRVRAEGRKNDPSGEIICKGPGGEYCIENVVKGWLDSPGHRDIMLDPFQKFFGAGYRLKTEEIKGNYWVVVFAYEE